MTAMLRVPELFETTTFESMLFDTFELVKVDRPGEVGEVDAMVAVYAARHSGVAVARHGRAVEGEAAHVAPPMPSSPLQ